MKKIFEANNKELIEMLDIDNEYAAFDKGRSFGPVLGDIVIVGRTGKLPIGKLPKVWSINSLPPKSKEYDDILIIDKLQNHLVDGVTNLNPVNTTFENSLPLTSDSVILMPLTKYKTLRKSVLLRDKLDKLPIMTYIGDENNAFKMLMKDKGYIFLDQDKDGFLIDNVNHPDMVDFTYKFEDLLKEISHNISTIAIHKPNEIKKKKVKLSRRKNISLQPENYRIISGLTDIKEGDVTLDSSLSASTDIGKRRDNQEDAILLIRDKLNPNFKMMAIADGMGGYDKGEVASDIIVNKLKNWFENLNEIQRSSYFTTVNELKSSLVKVIKDDIIPNVFKESNGGGSTLVCAIVGKNDTLVLNVGDSRAYIVKNGKLNQVSREDSYTNTKVQSREYPDKEAGRFDRESNIITQDIGLTSPSQIKIHSRMIENEDYDTLLLFSDGVTDCLSDDNIMAICKYTDRKKLASKLVEYALRHDSTLPEDYADFVGLNQYILGGKDNASAVVYNTEDEDKER